MKTLLLVLGILLAITSGANADVIGVFTDATGDLCMFNTGFNTQITFMHKFSLGTTASRFKIVWPAGSSFLSFQAANPYVPIGSLNSDITIGYGQCKTGSFVIGTALAILAFGVIEVQPADPITDVLYYNCSYVEHISSTSWASVAQPWNCYCCVPTEPTTWGQVKALYR